MLTFLLSIAVSTGFFRWAERRQEQKQALEYWGTGRPSALIDPLIRFVAGRPDLSKRNRWIANKLKKSLRNIVNSNAFEMAVEHAIDKTPKAVALIKLNSKPRISLNPKANPNSRLR